ncbi:hypothetical protein C7N43_32450 [Sphingobacteriales bacterium UPWRP_1]|nr:hypothetical protein B6N25_05390 [Sphingobacteriales bacterium TSM_CSS]PSJ72784.1 hypothetical protein C7N43_32450 [Sphingobacteriales bacterium UPWRP_1]
MLPIYEHRFFIVFNLNKSRIKSAKKQLSNLTNFIKIKTLFTFSYKRFVFYCFLSFYKLNIITLQKNLNLF